MKYNLNTGVLIETTYGDKVVLYATYFVWKKTGDYYEYSKAPENMLLLIWEAKWPCRNSRDRTLRKTYGFDFEKAFKRKYTRWNY